MSSNIPISYFPQEPQPVILGEQTQLQGVFLAAMAYGVELALFAMTSYFLWKRRGSENRRQKLYFIVYKSIIFALSTLYVAALLQYTQLVSVEDKLAHAEDRANLLENDAFNLILSITLVVKSWLCDIINLWRSFVIYQGCRVPYWIVNIVPMLLYLASLVLGVFCIIHLQLPVLHPATHAEILLLFPRFTAASLGLNILVTVLLVSRLLFYRRRLAKLMGKRHGSNYVSLATIIVESAAIHSFAALLFIANIFSTKSQPMAISQAFGQMISPLQGISTFLIFFRVAKGKGWTNGTHELTVQTLSTLGFAHQTRSGGLSGRETEDVTRPEQGADS